MEPNDRVLWSFEVSNLLTIPSALCELLHAYGRKHLVWLIHTVLPTAPIQLGGLKTSWLVSLRFGHGEVTCGDLQGCDAVQICTQKKQTASVPNPEGHKTAAVFLVLPTYSVCSQQSELCFAHIVCAHSSLNNVLPTQRVLTVVLIMFCPHSVCSQQS